MRQWLRDNGPMLVVIGVLAVAAGLAYRRPPGACSLPGSSQDARASAEDYPAYSVAPGEREYAAPADDAEDSVTVSPQTFGSVEHATDADFDRVVLESSGPVLVDFYADWCGPCRALAPVVEELARERPQVRVVKVNVDHSPALARRYGISSIPTVMVFRDGRPAARHVGLADRQRLETLLAAQ